MVIHGIAGIILLITIIIIILIMDITLPITGMIIMDIIITQVITIVIKTIIMEEFTGELQHLIHLIEMEFPDFQVLLQTEAVS